MHLTVPHAVRRRNIAGSDEITYSGRTSSTEIKINYSYESAPPSPIPLRATRATRAAHRAPSNARAARRPSRLRARSSATLAPLETRAPTGTRARTARPERWRTGGTGARCATSRSPLLSEYVDWSSALDRECSRGLGSVYAPRATGPTRPCGSVRRRARPL